MYAIISAGNKQYKVSQGETIYIDKVNQADGSAISFDAIMVARGDLGVELPRQVRPAPLTRTGVLVEHPESVPMRLGQVGAGEVFDGDAVG